jgi:hypothetical protein
LAGDIKNLQLGEVINILRKQKAYIRTRYRADVKGVFGSYAKYLQKKESDIDILVEFDPKANLLDLTGLSIYLEELLNRRIDIVPQSALRSEIKEEVLKEAAYL